MQLIPLFCSSPFSHFSAPKRPNCVCIPSVFFYAEDVYLVTRVLPLRSESEKWRPSRSVSVVRRSTYTYCARPVLDTSAATPL